MKARALLNKSQPQFIKKNIQLIASSPLYHNYINQLERESASFWSSPSPKQNFERYQLGSEMLPPSSTPPDEKKTNMLEILSKRIQNTEDELMFHLE